MEDSTISFNYQDEKEGADQFATTMPGMQFEPLREGPAKIKVIGVGGGGGNAVNHMYRQGIQGVEFIVCNTDAKALESSPVPNKIVLGKLGAGNVPSHAREMALAHKDEIRQAISNDTQMLFITAGMGGGTGTGAAPVIAEIAKSIELDDEMVKQILVVAIVTEPFFFEGRKRLEQARAGIEELKKYVDAILVINNDKLRRYGNVPLKQAFSQADDVLLTAAKGIAEIITVSAYVNIDFRDVNTVMANSGTALMGAGEGHGEDRARQAIEAATTSALLNDNDICGAQNILLYFSCSPDHQITMDELGEVTDYLTELTGNNGTNVIWGIGDDDSLNDELHITLIATGFQQKPGPVIHELPPVTDNNPDPEPNGPDTKPKTQEPEAGTKGTAPVEDIHEEPATPATPAVSAVSATDDPFAGVKANTEDGKRRITLEMSSQTEAMEQDDNEARNAAKQSEEEQVRQDSFDQIRVFKRETGPVATAYVQPTAAQAQPTVAQAQPTAKEQQIPVEATVTKRIYAEPVVQQTTAAAPKPEPVAAVNAEAVSVANLGTVYVKETVDETKPRTSYADQQLANALTPQTDEQKIMARAERIRKMNELLRNDPDGPRKVEELTTEQLTGEPLYHVSHSSESDAARTIIGASGIMSSGASFLDNLPD